MESKHLLLLLPIGAFIYILLSKNNLSIPENPSAGKEEYYLRYNKDEIMKNLVATEEHFRNVEESGIDREGFLQCNVKHLASSESHADEAISHALIAESEESSKNFRTLRNNIRNLRYDLQGGQISPEDGIRRTRALRRSFESFNPDYDISKCEACEVHVEITGLGA